MIRSAKEYSGLLGNFPGLFFIYVYLAAFIGHITMILNFMNDTNFVKLSETSFRARLNLSKKIFAKITEFRLFCNSQGSYHTNKQKPSRKHFARQQGSHQLINQTCHSCQA